MLGFSFKHLSFQVNRGQLPENPKSFTQPPVPLQGQQQQMISELVSLSITVLQGSTAA